MLGVCSAPPGAAAAVSEGECVDALCTCGSVQGRDAGLQVYTVELKEDVQKLSLDCQCLAPGKPLETAMC